MADADAGDELKRLIPGGCGLIKLKRVRVSACVVINSEPDEPRLIALVERISHDLVDYRPLDVYRRVVELVVKRIGRRRIALKIVIIIERLLDPLVLHT